MGMATEWLDGFYKSNPRKNPENTFNSRTNTWSHEIGQRIKPTSNSTPSKGANAMGELSNLLDPFANMYDSQSKTQDDWTKAYKEMNSWAMPVEDDSFSSKTNEVNLDPFQDFKFGMNMPTFGLMKGGLDTGSNLLNVFNQFRDYGLRKDMFGKQMEMADKQYDDEKEIQNIKFDKMDFNRAERNNFKKAYGGSDGNYLMEDPVSRRA